MQATHSIWVNLQEISEPAPQLERATTALSPLVTQILHNRGIAPEEIPRFLRPDWRDLGDPHVLLGMDAAVRRVLAARERGEVVAVYGDSDVDGITGTVLLVQALATCGVAAIPYVPQRQAGGACLTVDGIAYLMARHVAVVVTVDCGITNVAEVEALVERGIDVIITDHHTPAATLPRAVAVIDPLQEGCPYPHKELAGVAVAFKLAQALLDRVLSNAQAFIRQLLDLVAIGSIADMVPLRGENRVLVWHGLRVLNRSERPGLQALAAKAGLRLGTISATDVGVRICPRLNAAGRLDHAALGYDLLTAHTYEDAEGLAQQLEEKNHTRQQLTHRVMPLLHEQIARGRGARLPRLLVVQLEAWAAGVAGLAAGKLVEEYGRPVVVLHELDNEVRGSARGTSAFDVLAALQANASLLRRFGGHQLAAGFTTSSDRVAALTARLLERADHLLTDTDVVPVLEIDAEVTLRQLTWQLYDQLQALEPCGTGNRLPLFLCKRLKILDLRSVGNSHLQLAVGRGTSRMAAIAFRRADLLPYLHRNMLVDLVFHLGATEWNECRMLQLRVRDIAFEPLDALSATMDLAGLRPSPEKS